MTNFQILVQKSNKTLVEISKDTGISYSTLGNYNQGTRTPKKENAKILADYFGVSISYLMGLEVEDFKKPITDSVAATETISQLRDIHEKRKRLLKKLRELSDLEAELLLAFNKL
ncbi:DNA-binding protein [Streptococcus canis FSL Z3-227]|uniref:DNA-binding protein n=1 Tax=Streptococcus canis FSL Z3-227 TaxID=482234 RepID=A0AAV3FVA8_STRCB|nr:DNA-binding protein [Streptococcus canis FSL Z3-227]